MVGLSIVFSDTIMHLYIAIQSNLVFSFYYINAVIKSYAIIKLLRFPIEFS